MNSPENEREFTRIPIKLQVKLQFQGHSIECDETRDVSMKGVFVATHEIQPENSECDVTLLIGDTGHQIQLDIKGKVERQTQDGMAIQFTEMGLEAYDHLHNVVLYNSHDPGKVEEEFKSHLGIKKRE